MIRRAPLRRTALRTDPAKARAWARRSRKPIPVMSAKRKARAPEESVVKRKVYERDGGCVALRLDPEHRCIGPLTPHRLLKGSQGGRYTEDNTVALCAYANGMVEDVPEWGRRLGLVRLRNDRG